MIPRERLPHWFGNGGVFLIVCAFEVLVIFVINKLKNLFGKHIGFNIEKH